MNFFRGRRVETPQHLVQMICTAFRGTLTQALAEIFGALRAGKQTLQQSPQVQSGAADNNRQTPAKVDFFEHFARQAGIFAGSHVLGWFDDIQQVVRNKPALGSTRLCRTDIELTHHGERVAIDDLTAEFLRERQR